MTVGGRSLLVPTVALLLGVFFLLVFSCVMLASVGDVQSLRLYGTPYRFLWMQVGFAAAAFFLCAFVACVPPGFWFRADVVRWLAILVAAALVIVHVPGLGHASKGAARWIRLGPISLQPSEFVKIAMILLISGWCGARGRRNRDWKEGFLIPIVWMGLAIVGMYLQHDLGSCLFLLAVDTTLVFLSGARLRAIILVLCLGVVFAGAYVCFNAERRSRVLSVLYLDEINGGEKKAAGGSAVSRDDAHQINMALSAFATGGWRGKGLGRSLFKQRYLPEHHTDFILAMVGEELGLLATGICFLLYVVFAACGFYIARYAPDRRQRLMVFGLTLHVAVSAMVNIGVVTGCLPTKGLALPFLSYGGSNMAASMLAVGLISAVGFRPGVAKEAPEFEDKGSFAPVLDIWNA